MLALTSISWLSQTSFKSALTCNHVRTTYVDAQCCDGNPESAIPPPATVHLKLATMMPLSGPLGGLGPFMALGATAAVNEIHKLHHPDGSNVVTIEHDILDSGCNVDVANQTLTTVLGSGTHGIIGTACSGVSLQILPRVIDAKVMMISPSNTSPDFTIMNTQGYYARTALSDTLQGRVLANLAISDGHQRASILYRADAYGTGIKQAIQEGFESAGGEIIRAVAYPTDAETSAEFDTLMTELAGDSPPVIFSLLFPENACAALGAAETAGLLAKQWYLTDGLKDMDLHCVGPEINGAKGTVITGLKGPALTRFKAAYLEAAAPAPMDTFIFAPQAYDAVMLMAIAAIQSGTSISLDAVRDASQDGISCIGTDCLVLASDGFNVDYIGAAGSLKIDENGDPRSGTYDVWTLSNRSDYNIINTITI